jgi:hypothetical protein
LKAGYTALAEFHYVITMRKAGQAADPPSFARRIIAARAAGIALTLLLFSSRTRASACLQRRQRFVHTIDRMAVTTLAADAVTWLHAWRHVSLRGDARRLAAVGRLRRAVRRSTSTPPSRRRLPSRAGRRAPVERLLDTPASMVAGPR